MRTALDRRLRHVEAKQCEAQPLWLREWLGDDLDQHQRERAAAEWTVIGTNPPVDPATLPGNLRQRLAARRDGETQ